MGSCLNPKFFNPDMSMRKGVRKALLHVAEDFMSGIREKVPNIERMGMDWQPVMTGSLTGPDYDSESDVDLHFLVDLSDLDENEKKLAQFAFAYYSKVYNENEFRLLGFPIETYIQDATSGKAEPHYSPGVYALDDDEWIEEPDCEPVDTTTQEYVEAEEGLKEIRDLELRLKSGDSADDILKDAEELSDELKDARGASLRSDGLGGHGNMVFKLLRRNGGLDRLSKLKTRCKQRLISKFMSEARATL